MSSSDRLGYSFIIIKGSLSFSLNDIYYGTTTLINNLYVLELNSIILNINVKKTKHGELNPTYLWHYTPDYVNPTSILKLQKEGFLKSLDLYSSNKCELYLLSKMTNSPFFRHSERVTKLLNIIYYDVYGPLTM